MPFEAQAKTCLMSEDLTVLPAEQARNIISAQFAGFQIDGVQVETGNFDVGHGVSPLRPT